ncbi:hypothetical protein GBF38_003755 [Nibea albiflora]|uniref:Uncharacterized protein n=1 Tax=Nibea albiflora TaxID=240163 RepID=A0ACB7F0M4_NIBAL|nr:hypothetical protein GBF38_003755 [Nibea albiflora]
MDIAHSLNHPSTGSKKNSGVMKKIHKLRMYGHLAHAAEQVTLTSARWNRLVSLQQDAVNPVAGGGGDTHGPIGDNSVCRRP